MMCRVSYFLKLRRLSLQKQKENRRRSTVTACDSLDRRKQGYHTSLIRCFEGSACGVSPVSLFQRLVLGHELEVEGRYNGVETGYTSI